MCGKTTSNDSLRHYDALLVASFGGPEGPDDVLPFLEDVVFGKNVPRSRLLEVAKHYEMFGGVSPINGQLRALLAALADELNTRGPPLPVYWGNLHWHPFLSDALGQMAGDGVRRALAFVTSAFGSYSGCRQYVEAIEQARREIGPKAPKVDKLRLFYNHPGFIEATASRTAAALAEIPPPDRSSARLLFTAHSLPIAAAERSPYVRQLRESCRLVADALGVRKWDLAYQSRSGPPSQPWLEPDVRDYIQTLHEERGVKHLVIAPIGFLVENMEVVYDLDIEVRDLCNALGVNMIRAAVVGGHPRLVGMIRELVVERLDPAAERLALGTLGPWPDECPKDCCR
ncbi:MAG: ferrochelatase [Pirellulales bacterium]|nr:ferrochelatase [Pirellulales bacterium]